MAGNRFKRALGALLFYLAVTTALLWRPLFRGEALVPVDHLSYAAPWSAHTARDDRPRWNPLHYDAVAQYWVFRQFATEEIRAGRLPLWNPYQFCGAPFIANNLSAVYYPPNLMCLLFGVDRSVGLIAAFHLLLAAVFTCAFLRTLGYGAPAATFGGLVYAFSTWQISWLELAPFIAASCWLPAALLLLYRLRRRPVAVDTALLMGVLALVLLAGHAQIALYTLLTSGAFAVYLAVHRRCEKNVRWRFMGSIIAAFLGAACIAAPQSLPTAELMAGSHRTGGASYEGYAAYAAYAAHPSALVTLFMPDFYGNPSTGTAPYIGFSKGGMYFNYAEGAMYVGLLPLILVLLGTQAALHRRPEARFAVGLASAALLIAIGTPLAAVLYFGIPGFSGSGSPARILVVWALAAGWLAAAGFNEVANGTATAGVRCKTAGAWLVSGAVTIACALAVSRSLLGGTPDISPGLSMQLAIAALSVLWVIGSGSPRLSNRSAIPIALAVAAVDLLAHGVGYNQTGRPSDLMNAGHSLTTVLRSAEHDRIAPINSSWSFAGPSSVLPPNLATALRIRDVQGYDSLFPGQYKLWLRDRTMTDPSPPEVGNMVFVKRPDLRLLNDAGVAIVLAERPLSLPNTSVANVDGVWVHRRLAPVSRARLTPDHAAKGSVAWLTDEPTRLRLRVTTNTPTQLEIADQYWPGWIASIDDDTVAIDRSSQVFRRVSVPSGKHVVVMRYRPSTTYIGLFLMSIGCGALVAILIGARMTRRNRASEAG